MPYAESQPSDTAAIPSGTCGTLTQGPASAPSKRTPEGDSRSTLTSEDAVEGATKIPARTGTASYVVVHCDSVDDPGGACVMRNSCGKARSTAGSLPCVSTRKDRPPCDRMA